MKTPCAKCKIPTDEKALARIISPADKAQLGPICKWCLHGEERVMVEPVVIGDCTLYLGDCLEIAPTLTGIDAVITDPPYGLQENARRVASRGKLAKPIDYGDFEWDSEPAGREEIEAAVNASGKAIVWGGNYFHLPPARGWLVWDKLNSGDFADCELAWTNLQSSVRIFRHMWNGMMRQSERDTKRVHPTQKPVALMVWCMEKARVGEGETVLDPFMGSGTTGIACMRTGRKFIGIEKDPKHFQTAVERIRREAAQTTLPLVIPPTPKPQELFK